MKTIALSGFMGCGKSSIGKELCSMLSGTFIDLDEQVEARSGRKIPEIFAEDGEAAFRKMEKECLAEILAGQAGKTGDRITVLSLGGGTLTTPECAEMVHDNTFCIYLKADIGTLMHNLAADFGSRPMLSGKIRGNICPDMASEKKKEGPGTSSETLRKRITGLMSVRSSIYENTAHLIIVTDGLGVRQAAEKIAAALACYCC